MLTFLQRLKEEWEKSPAGNRKTDGKNMVWFGKIERKLAKLSKTTFTYHSRTFNQDEKHRKVQSFWFFGSIASNKKCHEVIKR